MKAIAQHYKNNKKFKIVLLLSVLMIGLLLFAVTRESAPVISHQEANLLYSQEKIKKVVIDGEYIRLVTSKGSYRVYREAINKSAFFTKYRVEVRENTMAYLFLAGLAVLVVLFLLYLLLSRSSQVEQKQVVKKGGQPDSLTSGLEPVKILSSDVKFSDVAGISDVKEELEEIIDFLKDPKKYRDFDVRLPKGVLLIGPPGVGKTMISKAVAREAGVPFFYQSGASFVHIYVGMGAKRVSELFKYAKKMAPSIIFIDEIDAVGKSRSELQNDEREATLNQLLTEMDGFEESSGVMVIAATNKIEVLDEALLRPGRFDRRIHISLPDLDERIKTLSYYLANKSNTVDLEAVGRTTIGFSSAALATLTNEAAIHAMRNDRRTVETEDFRAVKEKVLLGKRKVRSLTKREREIQAVYQGAKATVATWVDIEFDKIGLLNTMFVYQEREIRSKSEILNKVKVCLAGSIASKMHFDEQFSNAGGDILEAKELIRKLVYDYAMQDELTVSAAYEQEVFEVSISEVKTLLGTLEVAFEKTAEYLLEHENIDQEQCREILREIF